MEKEKIFCKKQIKQAVLASGLAIASSQAYSSGFQISEATVAGLGRAFAGAGIAGDDVSDMFYNPAGMFLLEGRQVQLGTSIIDSKSDFNGTATPLGGDGDDGGEVGVVPNFYYVFPSAGNVKYGLSITAPFGLATEYSEDWAGRYQALRSELTTLDINPSMAVKINDQFSVGAGISLQYAQAELTSARFLGPGTPDGKSKVDGDNWHLGFNLGAMFKPTESTRFGIGFRSKIKQKVEGDLKVTSPTGSTLISSEATAQVELPESIYLSAFHSLNDKVDLLVSARWTNWSRFEELRVKFDNGLPDQVTEEKWDDSWTLSIGANYHLNNQWTLRAGYAFDQSPVSDEYRTARIPDSDRDWYTLGASFNASEKLSIDVGYAHLESDGNTSINETTVIAAPPTAPAIISSSLVGEYDGSADIFGFQIRYQF